MIYEKDEFWSDLTKEKYDEWNERMNEWMNEWMTVMS